MPEPSTINGIKESISSLKDNIVLILLSIVGTIDFLLLIMTKYIPKIDTFVNGRKYLNAVKIIFSRIGLNTKDVEKTHRRILFKTNKDSHELIKIIGTNILHSERGVEWASDDKTEYYVRTMDAALKIEERKLMSELMQSLIKESLISNKEYYIFTPKTGNVALTIELSDSLGWLPIISKMKKDNSKARSSSNEDKAINFEGFAALEELIERTDIEYIEGIACTCNITGGSEIIESVKEWNSYINTLGLESKIRPIKKVFTLFLTKSKGKESEDFSVFKREGLSLKTYLKLTEKNRKDIYDACVNKNNIDDNKIKQLWRSINAEQGRKRN